MTIAEAGFRRATPDEQYNAQSYLLTRALRAPFYYGNALWTSVFQRLNAHNTLLWRAPLLQKVYDVFMHTIGLNPTHGVIDKMHSLKGENFYLKDPLLIERFFAFHRNGKDGIFAPNKSMTEVAKFLQECFPSIQLEDFLGTCADDQTQVLHQLLQRKLNGGTIITSFDVIKDKCADFLKGVSATGKVVNFNEVAREFTAEVMGQHLFDDPKIGLEIGKLIFKFKGYLIRKFLGSSIPKDAKLANKVASVLRECSKKILEDKGSPLFFGSNLSEEEKLAMIFIVLFAAQDNSATLLTGLVAHLRSQKEDRILNLVTAATKHLNNKERTPSNYPKEIDAYVKEVLKLYPPVPIVARGVKNDLCLDYRFKGEGQMRTLFIPQGTFVTARMIDIGARHFGEDGPHTCPGKQMTLVEVKEFFCQLLAGYDLEYDGEKNYHLESQVTANIRPDVLIRLIEPDYEEVTLKRS